MAALADYALSGGGGAAGTATKLGFLGSPVAAAGIAGLASLAGGLFGAKSAAKQREREMLMQGLKEQTEAGKAAAQQLGQGSQNAFAQLMQSYGSILGR